MTVTKGIHRVLAIARQAGLDVCAPEYGSAGILWVSDYPGHDIAVVHVSRRGAVVAGHGYLPNNEVVFFKGSDKAEQVCDLLQRYDPVIKQAI